MKQIELHGKRAAGRVALVDDEDYELVSQYRWRIDERKREGWRDHGPYAIARIPRQGDSDRSIYMHKLITGYAMTDHRNGDGLDNQRSNLRPATRAQNNYNQRPYAGHSSRFKGVTWHKGVGKWQAAIKVNGKNRYLGVFALEEDAAAAYAAAALKVQGEYAYAAREAAA